MIKTYVEKSFFTEVTGKRVSCHYARNIYIKIFLKRAFLWILLKSKILYYNISKFVQKYLRYVQLQVFSPELISPLVLFSRNFSIHQEHLLSGTPRVFDILFFFFFLTATCQARIHSLCFFEKSDALYLFSTNQVLFNLSFKNFTYIESMTASFI